MAAIGDPRKIIIVEPIETPIEAPKVPANDPIKEPIPA